ncbi:MAG: HAMP domain-containing histidine kinase [Bacteroidetes bacterium]|nr:HAMP domain-containing histidine kinase [Bacteroidota bacterium]
MKPHIIVSASLFALIVFLSIQFYTIINVYQVRSHDFDTRYNQVIREAMDELNDYSPELGLDSMYWYMDKISFYFKGIGYINDPKLSDSLKATFYDNVMSIMTVTEPFSNRISYKLNQQNMDPNLRAGFIIHDYTVINDFDDFPIVRNDTLILGDVNSRVLNQNLQGVLLDNFRVERSFFSVNFDVYVDFTRKRQVIYSEMIGVLVLITVSILIISLVFYFTLRNLMKQKKISDLKSDFINNMTHELKTPLSTISLANQGLSNEDIVKNPLKIKEYSNIISRQNKHLTQIIDQILDISMWEKQKINLVLKQIDFVHFLNEKIDSFKLVHEEVQIKTFIPRSAFFIYADAFQLSIALNNLLDNAVKYKRGELNLIIDLIVNPDEMILKIKDNGIGINPNDQKHIFEKFYRVNTSSVHNTKGLGLGLFYVKSIIEAHGGELWLESELNIGTTFFIKLKK